MTPNLIAYYNKKRGTPVRSGNRVVGEIANGILIKHCRLAHMVREPKGWAWDASIIGYALSQGATKTAIIVDETKTVYEASLDIFRQHGIAIDRGFGPQICLKLEWWTITGPDGIQPARQDRQPAQPAARQLNFWGRQ